MLPQSEQYGRIENTGAPAPMLAAPAWPAVDRRRRSSGPDAVPQGVYTLRALVSLIHRRRFPLAAAFLVLFAAACAVSVLMPKRYEAEAKLMVKRARVDAPVTLERGAAATVSADMTEAEVSAEIELLRSRGLLEEVAVACGLVVEKPTEDRRAAVARAVHAMEKGLTVLPVGKTNLIAVQYRAAEPDLAAQVVNRLVEGYLRKHVAVHRTGNTAVFFKSQAANFEKELNEAQQQFAGFRNKDSVSSLPEQKSSALKRVSDLEAAVEEADSGIRDADNRARLLRQQRASLPSTIETGSRIARSVGLIERLKGQLLELENKRTELLTKYEPGYRLVREVEKQIHDTRAALEREQSPSVVDRTDAPNPLRQSIEADLLRTEASIAGLRARRSSLAHDLAQSRSRLQRLDMLTGEHDDLQRRLKLAEENFLLYQKKGEESRLEDALDQQRILNVSVVEKAVPPAGPAPRHRSVILVIGLLVACFGAISTAFLADYFCQAPGLEAAASPAIRTRPVRAESIPAPEPAQRAKRPVPPPPPLAPRPATNADRAAFVAAGMERY
ncbi:MAG: Wzz/FepE/Etk N-terminal domain-containing protein, partial [Acidobacteria bacterium]|nr:Wzz/FepE/Etk N-terminal domain-containing protein [Acidobacteriota bacterium]